MIRNEDTSNVVEIHPSVEVTGRIQGKNNVIRIDTTNQKAHVHLDIRGSNNHLTIGRQSKINRLVIRIGNHLSSNHCTVAIGENFSCGPNGQYLISNSGNTLSIGDDCMFSREIVMRCGEFPHLLFDTETGNYLDTESHLQIGKHCWIGEGCFFNKKASLAKNSIVGARSVVTRRFLEENIAIGGNPAKIIRQNVSWQRNPGLLTPGSREYESFNAHHRKYT